MSALAMALWAAVAAAAPSNDLTFEQTATTTVDGKAGPAVRSKVYWSGRKVRLESGDAFEPLVMLVDLEQDRAYRLDAASRTAVRLDVDGLRARAHMGFAMAGDSIGAGEDSLRGQVLPGTRVIAGYRCTGHRLRSGGTRIDVWLAKGVAVDMDAFAELLDWSGASAAMGGLLPALRELGGFPMETRSRLTADRRVYETRAAVTSLDQKELPPSLFEVPSTFRIEDENPADPAP